MKKSYKVDISKPINIFDFPASGYSELKEPANLLAVAIDRYQTPISNDANLAGESLFTIDKPIGESVNSTVV